MSALPLALVLLAALCHAVWNLAAKRVADGGFAFVWCYDAASVVLWAPLALVVLARSGAGILPALLPAALVSGLIHVAYQLTLPTGYARADLGVVYPVARGPGPVLSKVIAILLLGERPGWQAGAGAAVVVAGLHVAAVGTSAAPRRPPGAPRGARLGSGDRRGDRRVHPVGQLRGHGPGAAAGGLLRRHVPVAGGADDPDPGAPPPREPPPGGTGALARDPARRGAVA